MDDEGTAQRDLRCVACGLPVEPVTNGAASNADDTGDRTATCARCGTPLRGPTTERLRDIAERLHAIDDTQRRLETERGALIAEWATCRATVLTAPPPPPGRRAEIDHRGRIAAGSALPPPPPPPGAAPPGAAPHAPLAPHAPHAPLAPHAPHAPLAPLAPLAPNVPHEVRPEVVRNVLLTVGALLLVIAAIIFAVVTWARVGATGRAVMLVAATLAATVVAAALRKRLPATAEAVATVAIAFAVADVYAVRRVGWVDGIGAVTWWAIGTGVLAVLTFAAGRSTLEAPRLCSVGFVAACGTLVGVAVTDTGWTLALALVATSVVLTVAGALARRDGDWTTAGALAIAAAAFGAMAALGVTPASPSIVGFATAAGPAAAVAAAGVVPMLIAAIGLRQPRDRAGAVYAAALVEIAAVVVLAAAFAHERALLGVLAVTGAVVAVVAFVAAPLKVRTALGGAGATALAIAWLGVLDRSASAVVGPLAWVDEPWSGDLGATAREALGPAVARGLRPERAPRLDDALVAVVVQLATFAAAAVALATRRLTDTAARGPVALAAATSAVAATSLLPHAAGLTVLGAFLVALGILVAVGGVSVALAHTMGAHRERGRLTGLAVAATAVAAAPAIGWGLVRAPTTIAAITVVVALALGLASARALPTSARVAATAVALGATITDAIAVARAGEVGWPGTGVVVAIAAGLFVAGGVVALRPGPYADTTQLVGAAALVPAWSFAFDDPALRAVVPSIAAFTFGSVAAVASTMPARRRALLVAAAGAALLVDVWCWLVAADVTTLEAYTVPPALSAIAIGWWASATATRRNTPAPSSWLTFGIGSAIGLVPSTLAALDHGGAVRSIGVVVVGVGLVAIGARRRLQAPLVMGAIAAIAIAVDTFWPVASRLPRWATIGAAGVLLLWMGATAERRLRDVRALRDRFETFG